jgi:probable O-glycosylation ligase (exosortase A-associated)
VYLSIALAVIVIGSLPFCFARPWVGILVWSWLGYMNPHRFTWGFAHSAPFAQLVAIATLAGLPFTTERARLPRTREVYLLLALWALFGVSTVFALYPEDAWIQFQKVSKILFMTLVTLLVFQDEKRLKSLVWVTTLSVAILGVKGGIWSILTGGGNQVLGPPESFMSGNTEFGLALGMILPLVLFLRREASRKWLRHGLGAVFVLCVIATLMTYSRGAFVGLAVVLLAVVLRVRARVALLVLLVAGVIAAPAFMPDRWFEKMDTIATYQQDESAQSRLTAWGVAYQLALERPLVGGGFRAMTAEVWGRFVPGYVRDTDAHSIYFQVLAEHGFVGLGLFIALILSTLATLRHVKRRSAGQPSLASIRHCAQMLQVSIYAYLVSGAFLSLSYFDLFYQLVAVALILKVLVQRAASHSPHGPDGAAIDAAPSSPAALGPLRSVYSNR